jgi:hypothetical protein
VAEDFKKIEADLVKHYRDNMSDSINGRAAYAELQLYIARRQGEFANTLNLATKGLRNVTIWLTIATFVMAGATIAQLVIQLHPH